METVKLTEEQLEYRERVKQQTQHRESVKTLQMVEERKTLDRQTREIEEKREQDSQILESYQRRMIQDYEKDREARARRNSQMKRSSDLPKSQRNSHAVLATSEALKISREEQA